MSSKKKGKAAVQIKYTAQDLVKRAEKCIEELQFDAAAKFLQRALEMEPEDLAIMDMLSECLLESGQHERASQIIVRSIEKSPNENPSRWMNLAQLQAGPDAVRSFQTGIDAFARELQQRLLHQQQHPEDLENEAEIQKIREQMSAGYCAIAEIFTTDCCDEPQAESECERVLQEAISICPNSVEAHQSIINLRLIQQRHDEAKVYFEQCWQLIQNMEEEKMPPFDVRYELAKMAYELGHYEASADLADTCLQEHDEDTQLWYLAGMAYTHVDPVVAVDYLTKTLKDLKKSRDVELIAEVQEILREMEQKAAEAPNEDALPEGENEDGDEEDEDLKDRDGDQSMA
eukprot:TRINITY_DN7630_c1_g1_i1.p1 TRINITY_DN7630_c1_g1~~TRINITY_DN7630_c1_g1_i1.p1  ORF type:complete len:345 (-),score=100.93 TRINITY_DN7630_c1_g1_i1:429-1463(-)